MIDGAIPYLRCPICEQSLRRAERALRCSRGHSFDMAKQGYVDLTAGRLPHVGDTAQMVSDRATFLAAGHYDFIAEAFTAPSEGLIVDAGTGTGHYLTRVLEAAPGTTGLGLDVSKPALRRAARAHPRAAAVLADVWRPLPIMDEAAAAIVNVFAPRNGAEFRRVLRPDGVLLVVTPAPEHLQELVAAHGLIRVAPDKADRVSEALDGQFRIESAAALQRTLHLSAAEARILIGMTPSARHAPAFPTAPTTVTAAVMLTVYRPL